MFAGVAFQAAAQTDRIPPPTPFQTIDRNGVNVATGQFNYTTTEIAIGQADAGGLSFSRTLTNGAWRNSIAGTLSSAPFTGPDADHPWCTVTLPIGQAVFVLENDQFVPLEGTGALTRSGTIYTYTALDGTVAIFDKSLNTYSPYIANEGLLTTLTRPNGEVWTYAYTESSLGTRVQSITNNYGYQLHFEYAGGATIAEWARMTKAVALNNAVDYCAPTANNCTFSQTWPTLTFGETASEYTVTDSLGRVTRLFRGGGGVTGIRYPSATSGQNVTVTWDPSYRKVASVSDGTGTWTYDVDNEPPPLIPLQYTTTTTIDGPLDQDLTIGITWYQADTITPQTLSRVTSVTNALNQTTEYGHTAARYQPAFAIHPEDDVERWLYDERGNLREYRHEPKPSSTLPEIVVTATYPPTCAQPKTCNKPSNIVDARGNATTLSWSATHGGLLSSTQPAPVSGAVQPQSRYAYQARYAWYRNSAGLITQAPSAITVPVETSTCQTLSACDGLADEVLTTTTYQVGSAGAASNLRPLTVSTGSGNGSLTATTTTTWTPLGDPLTVNGPLAGWADTTRYVWDAMRQLTGIIDPDPDGSGPLAFPATRTIYNGDGRPTAVQRGTTTGQSDSAWAAFSSLAAVNSLYDSRGNKVRDTEVLGSGTLGVTQYSWNAAGQAECVAVRMNPSVFGSLPTSACSLSTEGAAGPDRITRNTYDRAGRPTKVESAVGSPLLQTTRTQAWTPNGQIDWVEDANGNRSNYDYDGFDRLYRLYFPSATLGAHAASTTDYEQYGYDAGGNLTSRRTRDNQTFAFVFDALNREIRKTTPGGGAADDVFSAYDNLGRRLAARFANATTGAGSGWTYDALGRVLSETAYGRALTYQYDLAGRRTRLTWPSAAGGYVDFTWDLANRLDQVRENGATSGVGVLADYAYDNLGRRTSITRGNTAATSWSYVANSRNYSQTQNLAGTVDDLTTTLSFNAAGQTVRRALSNAAYDYGPPTLEQLYLRDGLNRYTGVGGAAFAYDGRQNLIDDGPRTYAYDVENRLVSISGGSSMTLAYDPLGRLRQTASGSTTTQFLYDGDALVAEYDGAGALTARYVHGAGVDAPLVWYNGATLTDRRWLHADTQGSIIVVSNASADRIGNRYSYSPYGEPDAASGFAGARFRYTGQTSLRHAPLWHYKARAYNPAIGRFMQTDPIGYEDGLNLYAYVANDPVNRTDPTGMQEVGLTGFWIGVEDARVCGNSSRCIQDRWSERSRQAAPLIDFIPIIGDIKGVVETARDPTVLGVAATIVGLIPGAGDALGGAARQLDNPAVQRAFRSISDYLGEGATITRNEPGVAVYAESSDSMRRVRLEFSERSGREIQAHAHVDVRDARGNWRAATEGDPHIYFKE